jgi:hypothetical protein
VITRKRTVFLAARSALWRSRWGRGWVPAIDAFMGDAAGDPHHFHPPVRTADRVDD